MLLVIYLTRKEGGEKNGKRFYLARIFRGRSDLTAQRTAVFRAP